jgi:hypothetical protein
MLTPPQKAALKTAIQASQDTNTLYVDGNLDGLATLLNAHASPVYWAWRTDVSREQIYNEKSSDNTDWDWTIYKGQGVAEQNAWVQMFMGDVANFSKGNLRAGIGKIFGAANANTAHCLAIGRRPVTRFEKVFVIDTPGSAATRGTASDPDTLVVEGAISTADLIGL